MSMKLKRFLFMVALLFSLGNFSFLWKLLVGMPALLILLLEFDDYCYNLRSGGNER